MSTDEAAAFAAERAIPFFETSAKTADNVESMFLKMAADIKARLALDDVRKAEGEGGRKPLRGVAIKSGRSCPLWFW